MEEIEICGRASNQVRLMGLVYDKDEAEEMLQDWLKVAALVTHSKGNYRYGAFILKVVCNQLQNVFLDSPANDWCRDCLDTGVVKVYDVEDGVRAIQCQTCKDKGVENDRSNAVPSWNAQKQHNRRAV